MAKPDVDLLAVNTLRFLAVDAVQAANSGHPGMPLGAAPMAYVLWTNFLKHNPENPEWFNRDRFILSAGHGSALLYSLLHISGYGISLEQLKQFRQWGSVVPGHPERGVTPGVEITTGPLGQGFANGVGMAIAEAYLGARFNKPEHEIINHFTYAIVSDGDLMEGVVAEAASLAGHLRLGKLIYLYDDNRITLAGSSNMTFTENVSKRFEAYGWQVLTVEDGNDLVAIDLALEEARSETTKPSLIQVRTNIGFGSPNRQDRFEAHGSPLGEEEVQLTKRTMGWPTEPNFYIPEEAKSVFRCALERGKNAETEWKSKFVAYQEQYPEYAAELNRVIAGRLPDGWKEAIPVFAADDSGMATRVASGKALNAIANIIPELIGGSADLNPSTNTTLKDMGDFQFYQDRPSDIQGNSGGTWDYSGRNIAFGVREHAMGAALNGMAAHGGVIPFGATFFVFSDYLRPAMRLAALMKLHVIYVFTHDSIAVGEDGATHQPIEQLATLRALPNITVIRPCDANETAEAWRLALVMKNRPVALVLSRQKVPIFDRSRYMSADGLRRGAYVLVDAPDGQPDVILIASGSEVSLVLAARQKLAGLNIKVRVVSIPSWDLFDQQPQEYRDEVLPPSIGARLSVEAASPLGWRRYVGDKGAIICMEDFGASAPSGIVMQEYGFSVENICRRVLRLLGLNYSSRP